MENAVKDFYIWGTWEDTSRMLRSTFFPLGFT